MSVVRRRHVFYVSGFDPKGASHYHALYKEQSALQARAGGIPIDVGPRRRLPNGNSLWELHSVDGGHEVHTRYEFMRWDDLIRAQWPRNHRTLWRDMLVTTAVYLWHGTLQAMARLSWPPALALALPPFLLVLTALGLPLLSAVAAGAGVLIGGVGLGTATGIGTAVLLLWGARALEDRFSMYWLMRSYAFTLRQARGHTPGLEARLEAQAQVLAERLLAADDDEVLVVGHSSGAIMAGSIIARALRRMHSAKRTSSPRLSFLTLGQCLPLLSLLPQATAFRDELALLATAPDLDWIDFSAPPDGCCFALSDPIEGCGLRPLHRQPDRPKLLSPRFNALFSPASYKMLKQDKLRMHFQYVCAAELPGEYDYFAVSAGASKLVERFSGLRSVEGYRRSRPFSRPQ